MIWNSRSILKWMWHWDYAAHDAIRARLRLRTRRRIAFRRMALRRLLPFERILPSVLIIGAQRGGTSSLYTYLARHPDAAASLRKEVGYFTSHYSAGPDWYRAHYPPEAFNVIRRSFGRPALLGFEATPEYLLDPRAAVRAAALIPNAKIIVLLRNPVARAWSHWSHMKGIGIERLSFPDALAAEPERLGQHLARLAATDPLDRSGDQPLPIPVARFSYVTRGRYADQLSLWLDRFPRENVLIVRSEDFFENTSGTFTLILDFLGLSPENSYDFPNVSRGRRRVPPSSSTGSMDRTLRARLAETFSADNERLYRMIGSDLGWGEG